MFLFDCKKVWEKWEGNTRASNMQQYWDRYAEIHVVWDLMKFDQEMDRIFLNANRWLKRLVMCFPSLVDWEITVERK